MAKFMLDGQEYCGGGGSNQIVKLTQAEYDALSDEKLSNNTIYLITDSGELTAENLFYDDTETGLGVNNVQDAIVEQNKKLDNKFYPDDMSIEVGNATTSGSTRTITLQKNYEEMLYFNIGCIPESSLFMPRNVTFIPPNKVTFKLMYYSTNVAENTSSITKSYIFVGK